MSFETENDDDVYDELIFSEEMKKHKKKPKKIKKNGRNT